MRTAPLAASIPFALAVLASAREPAAFPASLPGVVQPDPGTGFSVDRRGTAAAFAASFRDAGDRYDPAASPTVFVWDLRLGSLRQLTAAGPSDQPSVANGIAYARIGSAMEKTRYSRTVVAFRSTANLAGKNADGSAEIFVWDSLTNGFTQITDATTGASSDPVIGARFHAVKDANELYTGQITVRYRVAFLSTSDLAGDNAAGLPQVFVYDSGLPEVGRLVQVSHSTAGPAYPPVIDGAGERIAFLHDEEVMPEVVEPRVFVWDRIRGLRGPEDREGLQVAPVGGSGEELALDASGRWLGSTLNYIDSGTGIVQGRMIRVTDLATGRRRDMLPSTGSHRMPSLGKGTSSLICLSTDPGDGGVPVAERPVELRRGGKIREIGLPAGEYGALRAAGGNKFLLLTSTEDLDGTNAAGREVLFTVAYRP